jgi:chromate transporter
VVAAMKNDTLFALAANFALMSLFAIGGANAALPEMYRLVVEVKQWMTDRQFADMFAIAQATPGPNVIIVALIGFHIAGLAGAVTATLAMCGPTCVLAYVVGRTWDRFKDAPWRAVIQAGMVPLSLGLFAASAYVITTVVAHSWAMAALVVVTAAITYKLRLNPLWIFAGAAILGLLGLV